MANNFFAGFDRDIYPGDTVMAAIIQKTNLRWCGFFLAPAPCHTDTSWMTKRAFLQGLGWGLAPLYVGQQLDGPGSHNVTAAQGAIDGQNAATLAAQAGFPNGSIIFLAIQQDPLKQAEHGFAQMTMLKGSVIRLAIQQGSPPQAATEIETVLANDAVIIIRQGPPPLAATVAYYSSWVAALVANNYAPGVYCSFSQVAQALHDADSRSVFWVFNINRFTCDPAQVNPTRPLIPGTPPFPTPDPTGSGVSFAKLWQLAQGSQCGISAGGSALVPVNFDSSVASDPSVAATYP